MFENYKREFNGITPKYSRVWKVILVALLVYFKLMKRNSWVLWGNRVIFAIIKIMTCTIFHNLNLYPRSIHLW